MINFIKNNKGTLIIFAVFFAINKFHFFSLGTLLGVFLLVAGIYYKEIATRDFFDQLKNMEVQIYKQILQVFDKKLSKSLRLLETIAKLNISSDEKKMMKKLYQIRRLAYKITQGKKPQTVTMDLSEIDG